MNKKEILKKYWLKLEERDNGISGAKQALYGFFCENAKIYLHDTNERLTREEVIDYNPELGGEWKVTIDRIDELVTRLYA